ncbi:DUF6920 family protein [Marinicella marina]|uniref:DUF6920 family protein n=1 Tax=Marinicella marina TaxID=2996016 RepID=UPI002260FB97|nr:DUF6544 family protein [Marinicella marina]
MTAGMIVLMVLVVLVVFMRAYKYFDNKRCRQVWQQLSSQHPSIGKRFEKSQVATMPAAVQRYFSFMIEPGSLLAPCTEFTMDGHFSMGRPGNLKKIKVSCQQILAPAKGFVWSVQSQQSGLIKFSGNDYLINTNSQSRMWFYGLIPMAEKSNDINITQSAYGRMVAESTIWGIASLLPQPGLEWSEINHNQIRVTVHGSIMRQSVDIFITDTGQPETVVFSRWSNANPEKQFKFQSFGAELSEFINHEGFMIATRIIAGNHYGSENYYPFYEMKIRDFKFNH